MNRTTTNRPRMAATYAPGTVRARRWHGEGDVRGYRPPRGWTARADLTDLHPITGRALPRAMWWIIEPRNNEQHRPQAVPPWGRWSKIRARRWPRPVPASKAKSPRRRLRPGGGVADVQVPCTRYSHWRPLARARFRWRPAAMGGACGATPRLAAAGCAKACRPRRWRFALVRHEGRFTDTPPGLAMEHPRHASTTWSQSAARSVLACRWGVGFASVRAQAGEAVTRGCRVGHVSIRERAARASLACRESW